MDFWHVVLETSIICAVLFLFMVTVATQKGKSDYSSIESRGGWYKNDNSFLFGGIVAALAIVAAIIGIFF